MVKLIIQQIKDNTMSGTSFNPNGPRVELERVSPEERILFLDALPTNTNAVFLYVDDLNYNGGEAEKLATALKVNTTLTALSLSDGRHGHGEEETPAPIFEAMAINTTLVSFEGSFFHGLLLSAAQKIAAMLEVNSTLQKLILQGCHIGNTNTVALTQTLGSNSTLKSLDLSNNHISAEGALQICQGLSSNSTLTEISFAGNPLIGDAGVSALIDATKHNPSLRSLNISRTGLTDDSTPKIVELIQVASNLETLDVRSSQRINRTLASIRDAIFLNETITAFYVIGPFVGHITDESRAIDIVCLRNEHNLEQKAVSLFELVRNHLLNITPEEKFPKPPPKQPKGNFVNPHRYPFIDPSRSGERIWP